MMGSAPDGITPRSERERRIAEAAWTEGALWAAVECGVIRDERVTWLVPKDNPYRSERYGTVHYG